MKRKTDISAPETSSSTGILRCRFVFFFHFMMRNESKQSKRTRDENKLQPSDGPEEKFSFLIFNSVNIHTLRFVRQAYQNSNQPKPFEYITNKVGITAAAAAAAPLTNKIYIAHAQTHKVSLKIYYYSISIVRFSIQDEFYIL